MNPILPNAHFIPDPEAHQWNDGRMYIYGSYDIKGNTHYCSHEYRVFSSDNLIDWEDHGQAFSSWDEKDMPWDKYPLYAPDCMCHKGKYYLYFCYPAGKNHVCEAVATSDNPYGPFMHGVTIKGPHLDQIDPAIFIDDDGQAYLYWGQFKARGARLKPSMVEIDTDTLCLDLINEEMHGFHEGASMRKRNGIYYLVYTDISRGSATCISYAASTSPLGPFKKGGVIIDNTGCDPNTWNNHGSIAEFNGQWYVFYHRSSQNSRFSRRTCIEPITFNDDGSIDEVVMTTQGVEGALDPTKEIEAYRTCLLSENAFIDADENGEYLNVLKSKTWSAFKYLDFTGTESTFEIELASLHYPGEVEIRLDHYDGKMIGLCTFDATGGWKKWQKYSCKIESSDGVHALYLVFSGWWGKPCNAKSFRFL